MKKYLSNSLTVVLLIVAGLIIMRSLVGPAPADVPPALQGASTLDEAIELAREQNKVVIAVASASWCGPCQTYKGGTLVDADVEAWIQGNAIGIHIDTDKNREDAERLSVRSIPATFVIDPEKGTPGTVVAGFEGALKKNDLLEALAPHGIDAPRPD